MLTYETQLWQKGLQRVAGVDEAGRGPLAGPVVAAAIVFNPQWLSNHEERFQGLTDSKKLTHSKREAFSVILHESAGVEIGIGIAEADEIDAINILKATHLAMDRALRELPVRPDMALVDGLAVPGLCCDSQNIVGGDGLSLSIAGASVIAKVYRDARMCELDAVYPQYGFARHKGYGTREHLQALYEHGPCPQHRRSFSPVREAETNLGQNPEQPLLF
ncbi:MAG: ribonuclease HII [Kiritimatiellae bacterium]|nr:ribonuclease HII [Kiritimatiellia bacterium]